MKRLIFAGLMAVLTGCGGGGGGDDSAAANNASAIAGLYSGSITGGNDTGGLVLSNGEYWFAYGNGLNGVLGIVQGDLQASGGNITSSNMKDFSLWDEDVYSATLSGSYVAGTSINVTATYPGTPPTTAGIGLSFESAAIPTTAAVAGNYTGSAQGTFGESAVDLAISSTGAITGEDDTGCAFTGQLTPVKGGYTLRVSFGGGTCYFPGQTLSGVALHEDDVLIGALKNAGRTAGLVFDIEIVPPPT